MFCSLETVPRLPAWPTGSFGEFGNHHVFVGYRVAIDGFDRDGSSCEMAGWICCLSPDRERVVVRGAVMVAEHDGCCQKDF
jgi:hypothetical protein